MARSDLRTWFSRCPPFRVVWFGGFFKGLCRKPNFLRRAVKSSGTTTPCRPGALHESVQEKSVKSFRMLPICPAQIREELRDNNVTQETKT